MPYPVVLQDDVINITLQMRLYDQVCLNSTFWRLDITGTGTYTTADVQTAVGSWWDDLGGLYFHLNVMQSPNLTYESISSQDIWPVRQGRLFRNLVAQNGAAGTDAYPSNVNTVLKRVTGRAAKRKIKLGAGSSGVLHIPGVPQGTFTGDFIADSTYLTNLQSLGEFLCQPIVVPTKLTLVPGIFHARQATPTFNAVVHADVSNEARVMRRRTVRVGI